MIKDFLRSADREFEALLHSLFGNDLLYLLAKGLLETLYMVQFSVLFAVLFGLPLGVMLAITRQDSIKPAPVFNKILGWVVNVIRSFPFMVLILVLLPFSGALIGMSTGSTAAIIALSIAAIPFSARLFEGALLEVSKDLIQATQSMGANSLTIIKMMLWESKPALANAVVITSISLVGYSAMAGIVGGGGLGDLAYRVGFQSFKPDVLWYAVIVTMILVQLIQSCGDFVVKILRANR